MQRIDIKKTELDLSQYIKRSAVPSDYQTLITGDTIVVENNEPKILYKKIDPNLTNELRKAVISIKYEKGTRTTGLKSESRIFGYSPRNTIRKDYCSSTSLAYQDPGINQVICDFGEHLSSLYKEYFPEVFKNHSDVVSGKILKEWRIGETPFTSGIVNKNNPLKYHFDAGNIKNVLSNMVVFKNNTEGGYLACPEYNIGFEVADNTAILFDGQKILHGVTPIKKTNRDTSYRYSIVYYTLQQMWNCMPINDEIARAQKVRTKRENGRASGNITMSDLQTDKP
ncbi:MAG: hypothetical protein EBR82_50310 [Caulobacteraceae bacterium]|nr:hypothetical protein [Caulobacteraceae bacterium]